MKLKLIHKILLAMFACTALVLALTTMVSRASIGRGFADFLQQQERSRVQQLAPELAAWYAERGSWDDIADNPRQFFGLMYAALPRETSPQPESRSERPSSSSRGGRRGQRSPGSRPGGQGPGPPETRGGPGPGPGGGPGGGKPLPQRIFLLDGEKIPVVGEIPMGFEEDMLIPVKNDSTNVGWLGIAPINGARQPEEEAFIRQLRNNLLIGLGFGLAVAILLAWLLARHLSQPVSEVARGIRGLASGNFKNRLDIKGSDEIAKLGGDVNRLSVALSEHETARKRWMSDMAHELRTPLAIISGELEAMSDGVRPLGKEQLDSVRDEVKHLSALINDLHSLALTDSGALAYKMQTVDLGAVVQLAADSFQGRAKKKDLKLSYVIPKQALKMQGDEQRLRQLLGNLLDNAVRYTDAGGGISIELTRNKQHAQLTISDTAPGASHQECKRLFERLYRMEGSRNRNSGGSGLGLAICRNIVEAHGGQITAKPGPDGGLMITTILQLD